MSRSLFCLTFKTANEPLTFFAAAPPRFDTVLGADAISVTIALPRRSDRLALPDAEEKCDDADPDMPSLVDRMGEGEGGDDAAKDDAPAEEDERAAADAAGADAAPAKRARESRRCVFSPSRAPPASNRCSFFSSSCRGGAPAQDSRTRKGSPEKSLA